MYKYNYIFFVLCCITFIFACFIFYLSFTLHINYKKTITNYLTPMKKQKRTNSNIKCVLSDYYAYKKKRRIELIINFFDRFYANYNIPINFSIITVEIYDILFDSEINVLENCILNGKLETLIYNEIKNR